MNKEFQVHMLNDQGKARAQLIAVTFDLCLDSLLLICPAGRELAIVRTKLEEAAFFAKKAMASDAANGSVMPDPARPTPDEICQYAYGTTDQGHQGLSPCGLTIAHPSHRSPEGHAFKPGPNGG